MRRSRLGGAAALAIAVGWAASAPAQTPGGEPGAGPKGPRDVITGARQARDARELEQAVAPAASAAEAPAAPSGAATPAAAAPDAPAAPAPEGQAPAAAPSAAPHAAADPHAGGRAPPPSTARANTTLPAGTIRVRVLDDRGAPVANSPVRLGIMKSDSSRESKEARTDGAGQTTFSGLYAGDRQAYRVNVPHEGATYSSTPFRLPPRGGYDVEIRRLPVTRDPRWIVMYVGATSIELKDDRIKVVQQARLVNIGKDTYVFPEEGTLIELPEGFTAVQSQEVMTDQKVEEDAGKGVRVRGSLTPGEVTLLWGFDLPLSGSEASFRVGIPWPSFAYRVVADAPPGLTVSIAGMPEPRLHAEGGRRYWITEIQRRVGETPFSELSVQLKGIPGPGPLRWIAALLSLLAVAAGVFIGRRPSPAGTKPAMEALRARRDELLERARGLRRQRNEGEIGPEYEASQLALITDELTALLAEEERASAAAGPRGAR